MLRILRLLGECVASLVGIALLLAVALLWRLHDRPLTTPELTPYIEAAASRFMDGTQVRIVSSLVSWDNHDLTVTLHVDGVKITDKRDVVLATLPSAGVKLNIFGLFLGQVLPTELMVDHLQINLTREHDGHFYFGDMSSQSSTGGEPLKPSQILQRITDNLANAIITKKLRISRTVVNVYDVMSKSDWAINIPDIALRRAQPGLVGEATIEVTQKEAISSLSIYYEFDRQAQTHTLSTRVDGLNPAFFAGGNAATLGLGVASSLNFPVTGEVKVSLGRDQSVDSAFMSFEVGAGKLHLPDLWDEDRPIKQAKLDIDYNAADGLVAKADVVTNGTSLSINATGKQTSDKGDIDLKAKIGLKDLPMDQFAAVWPKVAVPNAREWIVANMHKGAFDTGDAEFEVRIPEWDLNKAAVISAKGQIGASRGDVIAIPGMKPVGNVSATATFDLSKMTIQILGGGMDGVKLLPFTMVMTGLDQVDQFIDIPLAISGSIPDVLRLIDQPPLGYASAIGLAPDSLTGQASGIVSLNLPLLKDLAMKDVAIKAKADLVNVAAPKIIDGFVISGGVLALQVDPTGFSVKGRAAANSVPFNLAWQDRFSPNAGEIERSIDVDAVIPSEQWDKFGVRLFEGSKGNNFLTAKLRQPSGGNARLDVSLDMSKAVINSDALSWHKPAGVAAVLSVQGDVPFKKAGKGGGITLSQISLEGRDVAVRGKAVFSQEDKSLVSLQLKPFKIGRNDAEIYVTPIRGDERALHYDIEGAAFDISGLSKMSSGSKGAEETGKTEYRVNLNRLYTSENGVIERLSGYAVRDSGLWREVDLQGYADGKTRLSLLIKADAAGRRALNITADDFGNALKGLGVTDTVRKGSLHISGVSRLSEPAVIEGTIRINDFTVHGLPLLVNLFNATSPFGIGNLISGTADFGKVRGKFVWKKDTIELHNVRATGSSIGLNADGKILTNTSEADLRGTVVPFSLVNRIIGAIPLIGDILTGGGDGILGVSYSIKGALADPKVSVNPASLLTPGFLRNIFFGGDDEGDSDEEQKPEVVKPKPEKPTVIRNFNKDR